MTMPIHALFAHTDTHTPYTPALTKMCKINIYANSKNALANKCVVQKKIKKKKWQPISQ